MRIGSFIAPTVFACGLAGVAPAQTKVDLRTQSKSVDFSEAAWTKSFKAGGTLPSNCNTGETFFHTGMPPGQNLYGCTATNTWTLQSGQELPAVAGQSGRLLSNDGAGVAWRALGGDISGSPEAVAVGKLRGRTLGLSAPADRDILRWNETASIWEPSAEAAGYVAGTGIQIVGSTIGTEDALIPIYYTGAGAPGLDCAAGRDLYTDTASGKQYFCKGANTWQELANAGGGGAAYTFRDNLTESGGTVDFNPLDLTTRAIIEEFPNNAATGYAGTHGWTYSCTGGSNVLYSAAAPLYHARRLTTGTTSGNTCGMSLGYTSTSNGWFDNIASYAGWDSKFVFRLPAAADYSNAGIYIGFAESQNAPTQGCVLRYDTGLSEADNSWHFVCGNNLAATVHGANLAGTALAPDTSKHVLRIRSVVAGRLLISLDGGTESEFSSGLSALAVVPMFYIATHEAGAAKNLEANTFRYLQRGISR